MGSTDTGRSEVDLVIDVDLDVELAVGSNGAKVGFKNLLRNSHTWNPTNQPSGFVNFNGAQLTNFVC
jgi:hypothetical protein